MSIPRVCSDISSSRREGPRIRRPTARCKSRIRTTAAGAAVARRVADRNGRHRVASGAEPASRPGRRGPAQPAPPRDKQWRDRHILRGRIVLAGHASLGGRPVLVLLLSGLLAVALGAWLVERPVAPTWQSARALGDGRAQ